MWISDTSGHAHGDNNGDNLELACNVGSRLLDIIIDSLQDAEVWCQYLTMWNDTLYELKHKILTHLQM